MIAGLVGMIVVFLIFVLVILFWKRKPNPAIALPLNNFLTSQGFTLVDPTDPILKAIRDAYCLTTHATFIEQAYKRARDDSVVCWLRDSDGTTNHLVATIPKTSKSGTWVMLFLPSIKGMGGNFIRKSFELSLSSSNLTKIEGGTSDQSAIQVDLYVKSGDSIPSLKEEFLNLLPQCGNIILRSTGSIVLIERFSISKTETWEEEARELLRLTKLLKGRL